MLTTGTQNTQESEKRIETETSAKVQKKTGISYWLAGFFFFILPFIMVSLPGIPVWRGRVVAVSSFIFFGTVAIFWYGLSPKSRIIRDSGKLSNVQYLRLRPKIEKAIRFLIVAFGVLFFFKVTLPFALDIFQLVGGEEPVRSVEVVKYKSVPFGGLWFLKQSLRFTRDAMPYSLFYSWTPVRVDESYEFVFLPRSRIILDFNRSGT